MDGITYYALWALSFFAIAYLAIVGEQWTKVNKAVASLMSAVLCWVALFQEPLLSSDDLMNILGGQVFSVVRVIFYLIGALTIVETINAHKGFHAISTSFIVRSQKLFFWIVGFIAFFTSSILDNLTTSIVMINLFNKMIKDRKQRLLLGSAVVVAVNAGGSWTPIGDLSTAILWLNDRVSTWHLMRSTFLPSITCLIVYLLLNHREAEGSLEIPESSSPLYRKEPGWLVVLLLGTSCLVFVPFFKMLTGLPPFMGVLLGLSFIWLLTDLIHRKRDDLKIPAILHQVDFSVMFFYLGLLLSIGALESAGLLSLLAEKLLTCFPDANLAAVTIGFFSCIVDNVALTASCIAMFDPARFPPDHSLWTLLAYAVSNGGSLIIIGSAAGIAFMALEKVQFMWYMRYTAPKVLIAYLSGFGVHYLLNGF